MLTCPNKNLQSWKDLVFSKGENMAYYLWNKYKGEVPLFQKESSEGIIASEKAIRDLAARISDRIGIPYRIISDRTQQFKGKLEGNSAVINLAYATLDTPIHEILGHPIIRAIKQRSYGYKTSSIKEAFGLFYGKIENNQGFWENSPSFKTREQAQDWINKNHKITDNLYQNLLKELEYGKGKEVLDRIKRDYKTKNNLTYKITQSYNNINADDEFIVSSNAQNDEDYDRFFDTGKEAQEYINSRSYSLEEQQEEAIVELLGMMTAEKLDAVKDGKLISLLKRLLKEMKQFVRSLLNLKEVEIDKLPDNMTIGDLADLLAYSNSKLILPGYEVEYTTPDNMKFKTYQEASNHITQLAKSVQDVDLSKFSLEDLKIKVFDKFNDNKQISQVYSDYIQEPGLNVHQVTIVYTDGTNTKYDYDSIPKEQFNFYRNIELSKSQEGALNNFIDRNKEYEQSKEIIEEWKKVNNIQYNPEEIYSRGQEFTSVVGAYSEFDVNLMMQNLLQHIEDNKKAGGEFTISAFTKPVDRKIGHLEGGGGKIKFKIYPQSKDIKWAANTDVYSGSVWDASKKVSKDKKSELLGVSYTKYPSLNNVNAVQPNLASIVDDLAHYHNELGIVLTGNNFRLEYDDNIPSSTKKIIDSINKILDQKYGKIVKPEIGKINSFENEYGTVTIHPQRENPDYKDSKIYGYNIESNFKGTLEFFDTIEEAVKYIKNLKSKFEKGIQPTQTKDNLKESIESVKDRASLVESKYDQFNDEYQSYTINNIRYVADLYANRYQKFEPGYSGQLITKEEFEANKPKQKEYTEQALINTKIAKLKEVAKKYPRSLIRSEVKPIYEGKPLTQWGQDELPFQKIPSTPIKPGVEELFDSNPELANQVYEVLGFKKQGEVQRLANMKKLADWLNSQKESKKNLSDRDGGLKGVSIYIRENFDEIPNEIQQLLRENLTTTTDRETGQTFNWLNKKDYPRTGTLLDFFDNLDALEDFIKENELEITPQQKQQALQLYSQYLESLNKPNTNPILQGNQKPDVILPIGISGSGKSTWIKSLPKDKYIVVSPDEIRKEITGSISDQSKNKEVFQEVDNKIKEALSQGKQIILDATNLNTKLRREFLQKFPNAKVSYKLFEANAQLSKERIKRDLENNIDRSAVPDDVIDRQVAMYNQTLEDIKSEPISNYDIEQEQEQVKKFVELQERLSNKEFLEGAKNAWESTPALQELGTQEEYNDYIARVSLGIIKNPSSGDYNYTSQVKDIVYHVNKTGTISLIDNKAFYSTDYGSWLTELEEMKGKRIPILLNITNPTIVDSYYEFTDKAKKFRESGLGDEFVTPDEVRKPGTDSVIGRDSGQGETEKTYVVYNSNQAHQLGGKQDIEGFKSFIEKTNLPKTTDTFEESKEIIKFTSQKDLENLKKGKPC